MQRFRHPLIRRWQAVGLGALVFVSGALAAGPSLDPQPAAPPTPEAVERLTGALQRQVASLAEAVGAHLGDESLGPKDVKAIIEVLALQRAVEVFANLVATHNRKANQEILGRSLPWVEEYLQRSEAALAEAPALRSREASEPPSAAHPVSIRSTLAEIRHTLGLAPQPTVSQLEAAEPPGDLGYVGPEPTDDELEVVQFNLERLRDAAEHMGRGKCYREFWTRHCGDALESHALPHQRRSFVRLMVHTRDLLRKYCASPRLAPLRREYRKILRQLAIRPIVYDYGAHTIPFMDRPKFFRLHCAEPG
ncbi:MAG: hypothetical protein ACE5KY_06665 [Candidatus Tectimicrobiota bacterium]